MATTEQNTVDKITGWAADKYTAASPSLTTGATPASTAAPSTASTGLLGAAAAPAKADAPNVDINSWYRSTLGRDADAAGLSYWQNALNTTTETPDQLYADFAKSATANKEAVNPGTTWAQANNYTGPKSTDGTTYTDDWGRNVLGRELSASESAKWKAAAAGAASPEAAQQVYADFLAQNADQVKNPMSLSAASQISQKRNLPNQAYTIDKNDLSHRTIDKATETVQGQLGDLLRNDNPVLQQARAEGIRTAFDRGLGNSTMAASAGSDSLVRAATGIATTDSGYYNHASDYNVAADNQATMFNAEQTNAFRQAQMQQDAAASQLDKQLAATRSDSDAGRAQALTIAQMQDGTTKAGYSNQLAIAGMQNDTTKAGQANQMTIAQMQDATTRLAQSTSTDKDTYSQKLNVANSIIQNMDLSPDRKAAMLEQLGFGTSATPGKAGTGLAGAVYVIDSTSADLNNLRPK